MGEFRCLFTVYGGTGKKANRSKFDSMAHLWDEKWAMEKNTSRKDFSKTEHWKRFKQYLHPPARILEAGCGTGQWVRSLDELGYEAYGIDFAAKTIERSAKLWPHLNLIVADLRGHDV